MSKNDKTKADVLEANAKSKESPKKKSAKEGDKIDTTTQLKTELENEKDRYLRLFAEFENFKKRTGRERIELFKTAGEEVIKSLLPVMDDFDRALKELEKSEEDALFQGVSLISNKLNETMRVKGLEVIAIQAGDTFDAEIHEAITQIPAPSEDLKGKIIDVIEKGYKLGEKIIRYPKVVIGQ